jgi:hypothetical protein
MPTPMRTSASSRKLREKPVSAVMPLQSERPIAITERRTHTSASRATGMPATV